MTLFILSLLICISLLINVYSIQLKINKEQFKLNLLNRLNKISIPTLSTSTFQCTNITHFDYQNNISLGNNDQANRTFTQLQQRIKQLNDITYKFADINAQYKIFNAKPQFKYRDSKQKAEIVGKNSILIQGGFTEAVVNFQWSRTGTQPRSGNATVFGLTDQVIFAKDIIIDPQGFFRYDLLDYINVTLSKPMQFTRYSPPDMSDQDKKNILKLVNVLFNSTTLRHQLQDQIERLYAFVLKANIHQQKMPIDKHFQYNWTNPTTNQSSLIQFIRNPLLIDIQKDGIHYGYQAFVKDWTQTKCGAQPSRQPLDPKVYGGSQQFISFTFYQNVLAYAISKGYLNTPLNRQNWQSRMFQFYAGDLYEIFPQIARTMPARTQVAGACVANTDHLLIFKSNATIFGQDCFNATFHNRCFLTVGNQKVIDFDIGLELTIQGIPSANHIDFKLKDHTEFVSFYDTMPFKIQNQLLARQMVSRSINRLYESKLFGSEWPIHPERDYPHFEVEHDYTVVFDTTHV